MPRLTETTYTFLSPRWTVRTVILIFHVFMMSKSFSYFWTYKGTEKRITLPKTQRQIANKRTCKVSDLSSPLSHHSSVGYVRSVKDCPRLYRLRLVPWPHYIFPISWHNKSLHELSSIRQALILSHTLSILLFHNPSNCTVYRLVVRLISEIHFCNSDWN